MGPDGTRYKTAYKCEGERLVISCSNDQTIKVRIYKNKNVFFTFLII